MRKGLTGLLSADGMYMMEVDRVLRPGGYWVLSGPPISWSINYRAWQRPKEDLQEEQRKIEEIARLLCWEKKYEKGEIAIWRKRVNYDSCSEQDLHVPFCQATNVNDVWYAAHLKAYLLMLIEWTYKYILKKFDISHFATTKQIMLRLQKKVHRCYTYSNYMTMIFVPCL